MTYRGGCHCGRIGFEVEGDIEQVVECNCSICSKRGYLFWLVPQEQLRLATPQADLTTYTFNTGRVRHHFCPHCGCAPFSVGSDKKGVARAAINARCLDGLDLSALKVVSFDGRSL